MTDQIAWLKSIGKEVSHMIERRRNPRYRVSLVVEYDFEQSFGMQGQTNTINISEGGVSIPLNKAIKPGKNISLRIKMPSDDKEVLAKGRIMWKKPINKNYAEEEDAGIKFTGMDDTSSSTLSAYIQSVSAYA